MDFFNPIGSSPQMEKESAKPVVNRFSDFGDYQLRIVKKLTPKIAVIFVPCLSSNNREINRVFRCEKEWNILDQIRVEEAKIRKEMGSDKQLALSRRYLTYFLAFNRKKNNELGIWEFNADYLGRDPKEGDSLDSQLRRLYQAPSSKDPSKLMIGRFNMFDIIVRKTRDKSQKNKAIFDLLAEPTSAGVIAGTIPITAIEEEYPTFAMIELMFLSEEIGFKKDEIKPFMEKYKNGVLSGVIPAYLDDDTKFVEPLKRYFNYAARQFFSEEELEQIAEFKYDPSMFYLHSNDEIISALKKTPINKNAINKFAGGYLFNSPDVLIQRLQSREEFAGLLSSGNTEEEGEPGNLDMDSTIENEDGSTSKVPSFMQ
jgi:hypothetical protein